jgi:hypothetical protein
MGDVKPWQIVVIVAAIVVAVTSFLVFGRGGTMIPGQNPKSSEWTLMPVEDRDGKLFVSERYLNALKSIPGEHAAIDASTGEVKGR